MLVAIVFSTLLDAVQQSPLSHEPKLAQEITARAEAETVGEFLARIGEETKTELRATPGIAEDVIILYAKAPAADILDKVAKHFDWTWEKDRESYVLKQSEAQRKQELADQEELILRPYLRWQQRAKDALVAASKTTADDDHAIVSLLEELRQHRDSYEVEYFSGDAVRRSSWSNKRAELDAKIAALARAISPTSRVSDELLASLGRQDFLDLDRTTKVVFAAPSTSWQRPFSAKTANASRNLVAAWQSIPESRRQGAERDYFRALNLPTALKDDVEVQGVRAIFKLSLLRAMPDEYVPRVSSTLSLLDPGGMAIAIAFIRDDGPRILPSTLTPQPKHVADRFDIALLTTTALSSSNEAGTRGALKHSTLPEFTTSRTNVHPCRAVARLMTEIASAAGTNLVSDCFESQLWQIQRPVPLATARSAFDTIAAISDATWRAEGEWVLFRSKHWQLKRLATVSPKVLYRVRNLTLQEPATIDTLAEIATLLSDRQLENSFVISHVLREMRDVFYSSHREKIRALRFWGTLSPPVRGRMIKGETLRFGALSAAQKESLRQFVYLCDERNYESQVNEYAAELGLDLEDFAWQKSAWPGFTDQSSLDDAEPTSQLPNGIPADAMIGLRHSVGSALEVSSGSGWPMKMTEASAIISGYYKNEGGSPYLVRPITQQRYFFTVWLTPEVTKGVTLSVYDKATGEAKPYDQQPSELKNRLEKAYKIRHGG